MRIVTTADITRWIESDELYRFYTSGQWQALRAEVIDDDLGECQICKANGEYSEATHVHHVNEVRFRPDLALCKVYVDADGNQQRNLISVCKTCHETVCHPERLRHAESKPQLNDERW